VKVRATTPRVASLGIAAVLASLLATPPARGAPPTKPAVARGKFLVATDNLVDPNFRETVVLMLEYGDDGALGVVINRPTDVKLSLVLPNVEELESRADTVFLGGPVARDRMVLLVRTTSAPQASERILDGVFVTSNLDVLRQMVRSPQASDRFRAFVGYAGWAPGQLDEEIARGDWNVTAGEPASLFEKDPANVWRELNERAGGTWVRAPRTLARLGAHGGGPLRGGPAGDQRSIGGVALPPAARKAWRASTLALTS
jgi:putative transcriptional regulator